jgi:hypothetical protein
MRSDARKKLADLQAEADNGFHYGIRAWVDNNSGAARVIAAIDRLEQRDEILAQRDALRLGEAECLLRMVTEARDRAERQAEAAETLAHQLLADADTTHRDPFLRGCATGTTDTAQAILERLGDPA